MRLLAWSVLLGVASVLAPVLLGPALFVAALLIPARIGVPLTARLLGWLRGLADLHRLWAVRVMDTPIPRPYRSAEPPRAGDLRQVIADPATHRDLRWLPANATVGLVLVGLPAGFLLFGLVGIAAFARWVSSAGVGGATHIDVPAGPYIGEVPDGGDGHGWVFLLLGGALLIASWCATRPAMRAYARFLRWFLAPPQTTRLANRIAELTQTRSEALDTQAAEIRRIERDLHDGAQAKLVALGMSLGMAEKLLIADPASALRLLAEAKQSTGAALSELRELVRGIQPPILADRGLDGAARSLVLASPMPIELSVDLPGRPPAPVESAVYFALTEILTNVTKHSAASSAWIRIGHRGGLLDVMVADNGMGGASTVPGGGLHGIQRRLAAFDGRVTVASPVGGPTIVTMEVPCPLTCASS
jgi:signal transduction histidine kinase